MKGLVISCLLLAFAPAPGRASDLFGADSASVRSVSGQFLARIDRRLSATARPGDVFQIPGGVVIMPSRPAADESEVTLEPGLVVISCERIKQALLDALGMRDQWQSPIDVIISPSLSEDRGTILAGTRFRDGWTYQLALPNPIKTRLLIRAVVQALLVEIANRGGGTHSAGVPLWLVEGLSCHLQSLSLSTLILQPQVTTTGNQIGMNPLNNVRTLLQGRSPLTFQDLSWPAPQLVAPTNYDYFSVCSQLFFEHIYRFNDGPRCLRDLLGRLPQRLNWQTAFLDAFPTHFSTLLDVEKWWALVCVNFGAVDSADHYTPLDTWHKLQDALDVPVDVRFGPDRMPVEADVPLQEIIARYGPDTTRGALEHACQNLELLRIHAAPDLLPLLDRYLTTLQNYLRQTAADGPIAQAKNRDGQLAVLRRSTCKQLAALDADRDALRSQYVGARAR